MGEEDAAKKAAWQKAIAEIAAKRQTAQKEESMPAQKMPTQMTDGKEAEREMKAIPNPKKTPAQMTDQMPRQMPSSMVAASAQGDLSEMLQAAVQEKDERMKSW